MSIRNAALFAVATCSLLGACGGQTDSNGEAGSATPAAAADTSSVATPQAASATVSAAVEVATTASGAPKRAAGQWELKNIGGGGTVIGTQFLCIDSASEEKAPLFDQIAKNINCAKYETARVADGWTFEFVCGPAGMTATTTGSASGDFASSYRVEMSESDGSMTLERVIEAKRLGDCPSGIAPGMLTDEQGRTVADVTK